MFSSFLVVFILISFGSFQINLGVASNQIFFIGPNQSPLAQQNGSKTSPYSNVNNALDIILKLESFSIVFQGKGKSKSKAQEIFRKVDLKNQQLEFR